MKKIRVLLLAGGQSEEHEVSIMSARSVITACAHTELEITPAVITRQGRWLSPHESTKALSDGRAVGGGELTIDSAKFTQGFDVVFPLIHGTTGEDGRLQGLLELAGVPYVGSGVLASALTMDKAMFKDVCRAHGIPQTDYRLVNEAAWARDPSLALAKCQEMPAPWFVKPSNSGSSVGINKARNKDELKKAIEAAFVFDRRVIVEQAVHGARELETAILGNDNPQISGVGEITYDAEFYDYESKYTEGRSAMHIPADVPPHVAERMRTIALHAYELSDAAGYSRVDFFYVPETEALLLNEINTIPGFTPFSMFSKLWEASGIPYAELVKRMIALAIERHQQTKMRAHISK